MSEKIEIVNQQRAALKDHMLFVAGQDAMKGGSGHRTTRDLAAVLAVDTPRARRLLEIMERKGDVVGYEGGEWRIATARILEARVSNIVNGGFRDDLGDKAMADMARALDPASTVELVGTDRQSYLIRFADGSSHSYDRTGTEFDPRHEQLTALAIAMMRTRPDLEEMSLDEWVLEHGDKLSDAEKRAATAIIELHEQHDS